MSQAARIQEAMPTGTRKTVVFANRGYDDELGGCRGGAEWREMPEYNRSPEAVEFRRRRVAAGLSLGDVARKMGVSVVVVSGLERGSHVPIDPWSGFTDLWLGAEVIP